MQPAANNLPTPAASRAALIQQVRLACQRPGDESAADPRVAGFAVEADRPADLLVWDPEPAWTLSPATLGEGLDATLWDGTGVRGRPRAVLRNGEVVA
jgi:dihydroorotase-like cyclic amidohydrolase